MANLVSNLVDKAKTKVSSLQQSKAPAAEEQPVVSEKVISRVCPNCRGCSLTFVPSDDFVTCPACDQSISTAELMDSVATESTENTASPELEAMLGMIASIDSPESGLIYLENFFSNYNWDFYKQSTVLFINEIASMVEKNKIKQGAMPQAWLLDFQSVAYPISKKLEGLTELEQAIAALYNGLDNTNILPLFDRYKSIVNALLAKSETIVKRLNNDADFAKKLGLPEDQLAVMNQQQEAITKALGALVSYEKVTEIPAVAEAKKKIDEQKIREFKARGIDVVDVYRKACDFYNANGDDKREALRLFESIRGYADTVEYINKINLYFGYYRKFYHFFNNDYLFRPHKKALIFNPTETSKGCMGKKKNVVASEEIPEEETFEGKALDLFPVVDKEPAEEPIIKGITNIITYYGSRLFYVKLDKYLCSYDMVSHVETTLCSCSNSDKEYRFYANEGQNYNYFNPSHSAIYVRRRLPLTIERIGCFKKAFGKADVVDARMNNFSVVKVDFAQNNCSTVLDSIVDITETRGDYMFYTVADDTNKDSEKITLMTYNMITGETKPLLSESCEIEAISGNKVAYTTYQPNSLNKELYVYDIATGEDVLIEKNIYSFFRFIDDRVYYYVGNAELCPLFSNNTNGTDRVEILTNVENIVAVSGGWMYVLRSRRDGKKTYNNVLIKISLDGTKRLVICSQLKQVIKQTELYIYYLDFWNTLRVVRTDGKENTVISTNLEPSSLSVDENCIYFLREERVSLSSQNNRSKSLYAMDLDGHNLRKILFSVVSFKNFDENTLYVEKTNQVRYSIFYPALRKKDERTEIKTFTYTSFYRYDKESGVLDNFLNINFPHPGKYEATGCFGKKHDMESVFTEIPIKSQQGYRGVAPGAIREEQIEERNALGLNKAGCGAAISNLFSGQGKKGSVTQFADVEPVKTASPTTVETTEKPAKKSGWDLKPEDEAELDAIAAEVEAKEEKENK